MPLLFVFLALAAPPAPEPLGRLIDIGGYRIHLYCMGKGSQTVVLSPGGGGFSFDWYLVQQKAGAFARVCSYDRAGSAWSDPGPEPRTMRQEAHDLYTALQRANERGPYILVGQSLGGLVMRMFAHRYPDATAGIILVDATSPDATLSVKGKLVRLRELAKDRPVPGVQTQFTASAKPAMTGGSGRRIGPPLDKLPMEIQKLYLWAWSQPQNGGGDNYMAEEFKELHEDAQRVAHPLGDRPLVTIVAMREQPPPAGASGQQWDELVQEKITQKRGYGSLSTNSKVVEDPVAGHAVHLDNPDTVVAAIRDVCGAVRRHSRLRP